ncbi:hypothetical protein E8E13_004662 [Curvularia kusanoi]|uniref:Ubiquitin-like protease family profile domain-containing protein n=1 Tax=Curvularia kusanoi TaxID=90978 RepID=A0A9P4TKQ3_CURKU|nr:hypothetical protein E8E13_004662 [Curvularia kusanoi]
MESRSPSPLSSRRSVYTSPEATPGESTEFTGNLADFEEFAQENKEEMLSREAGFQCQTRGIMRIRTHTMFAHSLRDYKRQRHAPTASHKPALLQRRYSIDVNANTEQRVVEDEEGVSQPSTEPSDFELLRQNLAALQTGAAELLSLEDTSLSSSAHPTPPAASPTLLAAFQYLDLLATHTPVLPFPNPHRYPELNRSARNPSQDDDCYLTFQDASITNNQFHYITLLGVGEALMQDYILDSIESQVFFFAAGDPSGLEEYSTTFGPAKWIFIPINDGTGNTDNNGVYGSHWSLLVLDRVHMHAHYYDSYFIESEHHLNLASAVFRGALGVLGEDGTNWEQSVEWESPHQVHNNLCSADAFGACGPFVWTMINRLVDHIQYCQRLGREGECEVGLWKGFKEDFGSNWHSGETRRQMKTCIAAKKSELEAFEATKKHDEIALRDVADIKVLPLFAEALLLAP